MGVVRFFQGGETMTCDEQLRCAEPTAAQFRKWPDLGCSLTMGRPRTSAAGKGLLDRMQARVWSDGKKITYRYLPVGGKPINLGTDRMGAIRKVLDLLGNTDGQGTLKWVWDKFTDEEKPAPRWKKLTESSRDDYRQAWNQRQVCIRVLR